MDPIAEFNAEKADSIRKMGEDTQLRNLSRQWFDASCQHKYSYHFTWMGRPIIQYPQDILALQELIWSVRPDRIVETGIAHGGSLIFSASMLELLGGEGRVLGIDIDIRSHNRAEIEKHPMFKRIEMIEGSSVDEKVALQARKFVQGASSVLVILDSNHTHEHVLQELQLYAPLVTKGSYLVVFDTVIEDMPQNAFPNHPWGHGNNPKTAVFEYLKNCNRFEIDRTIERKLQLTVAPDGYLKCVGD